MNQDENPLARLFHLKESLYRRDKGLSLDETRDVAHTIDWILRTLAADCPAQEAPQIQINLPTQEDQEVILESLKQELIQVLGRFPEPHELEAAKHGNLPEYAAGEKAAYQTPTGMYQLATITGIKLSQDSREQEEWLYRMDGQQRTLSEIKTIEEAFSDKQA